MTPEIDSVVYETAKKMVGHTFENPIQARNFLVAFISTIEVAKTLEDNTRLIAGMFAYENKNVKTCQRPGQDDAAFATEISDLFTIEEFADFIVETIKRKRKS